MCLYVFWGPGRCPDVFLCIWGRHPPGAPHWPACVVEPSVYLLGWPLRGTAAAPVLCCLYLIRCCCKRWRPWPALQLTLRAPPAAAPRRREPGRCAGGGGGTWLVCLDPRLKRACLCSAECHHAFCSLRTWRAGSAASTAGPMVAPAPWGLQERVQRLCSRCCSRALSMVAGGAHKGRGFGLTCDAAATGPLALGGMHLMHR
jgi:hypothetical protein